MKAKKSWILLFAALLMAYPAAAQSTTSAQTQASTSTSAQAKAGKADVKADSNSSADASAKSSAAQSQQENKEKEKGAKANAKASSQSSANGSAGDKSLNLSYGTTMEAELTKSLDVKRNKVGDEVVAKVTKDVKSDGQVVVPKGSKLIGHVTEAKARGKGESQSALGVAFDRAVMKDGREVPVNLAIQAVASAQTAASSTLGDDSLMSSGSASGSTMGAVAPARSGGSSGGGLVGGVGSTVSGATSTVGSVAGSAGGAVGGTVNSATQVAGSGSGSAGGLNAVGGLTSQSSGVFGLQGLQLNSEASHATEGSLLVSSTRDVHLDSGTRMLLRAAGTADAKPKQ